MRFRRIEHRWVPLAAAALLIACHPLKQYQCDTFLINGGSTSAPYRIGFVELDDQGVKYSAQQLANVVHHIETEPSKLVVVFAHGWFHNAERDDENLKSFEEVLGQASILESAHAQQEQRAAREGLASTWAGAVPPGGPLDSTT